MLVENTVRFLNSQFAKVDGGDCSVYMTSSFQTQSVPLLHLVSLHFPFVKVVFIDTGFLFPETYQFQKQLKVQFKLNAITVSSNKGYIEQRNSEGLFLYSVDTDRCCYLNKVEPLNALVRPGDYWISGVRRDQTAIREQMKPVERDERGVIRLHPMLDWTAKDIYNYINANKLPKHPLEAEGYVSIGCMPCTQKWTNSVGRGGRWVGRLKTECGLHTENRI